MKKILIGVFVLLLGLIACNKDDFERNKGFNDLDLKAGILTMDEAGSAFAYGTHVFTSNPKSNPDGLASLNLKNNRWGWASLIEASEGTTTNPINETYHFYINTQTGIPGVYPATTLADVVVSADETNLYITITLRAGYSFSSTHWDQNYPYTIKLYLNQYEHIYFRPHGSTEPFTAIVPFDALDSRSYTFGDAIVVNISAMIEPIGVGYAYVGATSPVENMGGGVNVLIKPNSLTCLPQLYDINYTYRSDIWGDDGLPIEEVTITSIIDDAVYVWNDETNLYFYSGANYSYYVTLGLLASDAYPDLLDASHGASMLSLTANSGKVTIPLNTINGYVAGETSSIYFEYSNRRWSTLISGTGVRKYKLCTLTSTLVTELPIYMGAGLNDTKKGAQVGIAYVEYDGDELKVKCDLFDEYLMSEINIYAKDIAPTKIAPGQFGFTQSFEIPVNEFETTLDVADTNGDNKIWLILHASVIKL